MWRKWKNITSRFVGLQLVFNHWETFQELQIVHLNRELFIKKRNFERNNCRLFSKGFPQFISVCPQATQMGTTGLSQKVEKKDLLAD
jgi:hypothetical protein